MCASRWILTSSLIIAADKRILDGFEATTTIVDWKSYKCKRVVRSSLAGETQAFVETLDMLEFTKVFHALFLDLWKSLSDVESFFETQHKSPVICCQELFTMLWRGLNPQLGTWLRNAQP